jgi:nucleoside phosphorylase
MNRYTDVTVTPHREERLPLPVVDWRSIGHEAPEHFPVNYKGKDTPLPKADVVVMTWTSAEWSALDHVFLNSDTRRYSSSRRFEKDWYFYALEAPELPSSDGRYPPPPLWGYYRLVSIRNAAGADQKVLLFKADAHLAHPLWIQALEAMVGRVIDEVEPNRMYSIGTAGGTSLDENLGDAAITNSAHISLKNEHNTRVDYNNQTFSSDWYPSLQLLPGVEQKLLFQLGNVINHNELKYMVYQLYTKNPDAKAFGLDDLLNAPLQPGNLHSPRGLAKRGVPLLTTDYYYIAKGDDSVQYCVLEMDDAVIAKVAGDKGVKYCFVRNVSDPLVPNFAQDGGEIPFDVRKDWSGIIYSNFGIYSSFNGALLTWATISGDPG